MKHLLLLLALVLASNLSFSQEFELPAQIQLENEADYEKFEAHVIAAADWLVSTPADEQLEKRKRINSFLIKWLEGTPKVTVEISQKIVTFSDQGDCLVVFLAGWAQYSLQHKHYDSPAKGNLMGIEAVINYYLKNKKTIGENKHIEKYVKLQEEGKLETYIRARV